MDTTSSRPQSVLSDGTRHVALLSPIFVLRAGSSVVWPLLLRSSAFLRKMRKFLGLDSLVVVRLQRRRPSPQGGLL